MMEVLKGLKYSLHVICHPFDGFWDLKHEKRGNAKSALLILAVLTVTYILKRQLTGYLFNPGYYQKFNILLELAGVIIPFLLWCTANWCLTTLMDGEGSFKDIFIATSYALAPLIVINIPLIALSRALTIEEGAFYKFFDGLSAVWTGFLVIIGTMMVHRYTIKKTLLTSILTVIGMGVIIFIGSLFFNLMQQMLVFFNTIYREIVFRI